MDKKELLDEIKNLVSMMSVISLNKTLSLDETNVLHTIQHKNNEYQIQVTPIHCEDAELISIYDLDRLEMCELLQLYNMLFTTKTPIKKWCIVVQSQWNGEYLSDVYGCYDSQIDAIAKGIKMMKKEIDAISQSKQACQIQMTQNANEFIINYNWVHNPSYTEQAFTKIIIKPLF